MKGKSLRNLALVMTMGVCLTALPVAFAEGEEAVPVVEAPAPAPAEEPAPAAPAEEAPAAESSEEPTEAGEAVPAEEAPAGQDAAATAAAEPAATLEPAPESTPESMPEPAPESTPEAAPEPAPESTPVPVPEDPIGQKQVCLSDASDSVNMYATADAASEIVGALGHGDVVDVYVEAGAWTLVRANGVQGWVASGHLKEVGAAIEPEEPVEPEEPEQPEEPAEPEQPEQPEEPEEPEQPAEPEEPVEPEQPEQPEEPEQPEQSAEPETPEQPAEPEQPVESRAAVRMVVRTGTRGGRVNLRAAASYGATILTTLREGDVVSVLVVEGGWIKVRTADGAEGYVGARYLSEEQPAETGPELPAFEYARDENGNLLLDEAGNPIPVLGEGAALKPVSWQRDENGELILDENGNPIPVDVLPVEAEKLSTLADALDPNRAIDIYINWADPQAEAHAYGDEAVLTAVLRGYDNVKYSLQWQVSADDVVYADVPGATEAQYVTVVTEENIMNYWRVSVTITGVVE